jgi:aldose 1-epimerase
VKKKCAKLTLIFGDRSNDPASPTGEQLELRAGAYGARIVEVGAGVRTLEHDGRPRLDGYGAGELCEGARGQLLAPWPNRIEGGRYAYGGEGRQLSITEPQRGCAIHGLVRWAPWRVGERERERVTLTHRLHPVPGYPHILDLRVRYTLHEQGGLGIEFEARNVGDRPAPYGLGMHPYLSAGTAGIDDCELTLPAGRWLPTDARGIPTGEAREVGGSELDFRTARALGGTQIDFAFTDLGRDGEGRATVLLRDPAGGRSTRLWVDRSFGWIEIFTGDHLPSRRREGLGVEPMTCPPNAFASGRDVIELEPGATHTARWGILAGD